MESTSDKEAAKAGPCEEDGISFQLMKKLRKGEAERKLRKGEAESGSSNGEANSDMVSIGNTSFGFNFDSEENTPNNSDRNENSEDSDGNDQKATKSREVSLPTSSSASGTKQHQCSQRELVGHKLATAHQALKVSVSSLTRSSGSASQQDAAAPSPAVAQRKESLHKAAAADAVASLKQIATTNNAKATRSPVPGSAAFTSVAGHPSNAPAPAALFETSTVLQQLASQATDRKRKTDEGDSSAGYHTDDEGRSITFPSGASSVQENDEKGKGAGKKKRLDEKKREERNQREKERSLRISKQINELRNLLSSGGVIVPKGTKSSVLTEAASYIRMLQQHQYRSELDRHQLIQQMQVIGNGAHGAQAARAVRHVAAQNGVWSLGNFGGLPPKSAMSFYQKHVDESKPEEHRSGEPDAHPNSIEMMEYKSVFNSCGVGMAIASLGGAFLDCNQLFCQLSNYSKQEVCGLTIFNLSARQDLQHAFDLISQMISPPVESRNHEPKPIVLRGSMKNRNDIGLCISLVKGEDGIAKCFCATLIKNPTSPFDTSKPIPVSFDSIQSTQHTTLESKTDSSIAGAEPAFTLG